MPAIRAAAYYRMSDDRQENSIDRQAGQVVPYAEKNGYNIVAVYEDLGITGSEIAGRKGLRRMLRDAQSGKFEAILCDDKDRFGRFDSIDMGEIIAPLRRKGIHINTVAQGRRDWESFGGRVTDAVMQEAKRMEQEAISRRVLSTQLLRARDGHDTGGRMLYGYCWETDSDGNRKRGAGRPQGRDACASSSASMTRAGRFGPSRRSCTAAGCRVPLANRAGPVPLFSAFSRIAALWATSHGAFTHPASVIATQRTVCAPRAADSTGKKPTPPMSGSSGPRPTSR